MHYDANRKILYIFDEIHENKKSNKETAELIKQHGVGANDKITADSAEPKSIGDYKDYGLFCRGAKKGPGSVEYSMKWLQSLTQIVIDNKRCPHTAPHFIKSITTCINVMIILIWIATYYFSILSSFIFII